MLISTGHLLLDTDNILYARAEADEGEITSIKVVLKDPSRTSFTLKGAAADEFRAFAKTVLPKDPAFERIRQELGEQAKRKRAREYVQFLEDARERYPEFAEGIDAQIEQARLLAYHENAANSASEPDS
jgi:hypothetical protein